jgi:hypothetical protein
MDGVRTAYTHAAKKLMSALERMLVKDRESLVYIEHWGKFTHSRIAPLDGIPIHDAPVSLR